MDIDKYLEIILNSQLLPQSYIKKLCRKAKQILFEQSNVQPVKCPVSICGDVHGQFYDLLKLFKVGGQLPMTTYIMLGDFVDRGYHSIQTISLLFCYKVKYPDKIILLRGNHQSRSVSKMYGFYDEIKQKYGNLNVWRYVTDTFDLLPLAAIVQGSIFCVHGGLSPQINTVDFIQSIERNQQIPQFGPFCDLMWSDPLQSIECWRQSDRGTGWIFGSKVVDKFNHLNNLKMIVRAHQLAMEGYQQMFDGKLYIIWSAPDYYYRLNNLGAIMRVQKSLEFDFIQFKESQQKRRKQYFQNLIPYFL